MNLRTGLISDCIKGKRLAQNELYQLVYNYLMSICIRYTRNQTSANEVLNIGFFKILNYLKNYKEDEPFKPWIRKIMINELIKQYHAEKKNSLNLVYVEDYFDHEQYSELNSIIDKINSDQIFEYLAQLPFTCREVFNLYIIDGYKHKEIAEMLAISEGTSKWYLNAAREKLKELILKKNETSTLNQTRIVNSNE